MRYYRALLPSVQLAVKVAGIVLVAAILIVFGVRYSTARHVARAAEQRECALKMELIKARNPVIRAYWRPADPCVALAVVGR